MKASRYNLCFPKEPQGQGDAYVVYNSLRGSLGEVDREGLDAVEGRIPFAEIPAAAQRLLADNGFFVGDGVDELKLFKTKFEDYKYDRRALLFTLITSYDCNLSCPYCYEGRPAGTASDLTPDAVKTIVAFVTRSVVRQGSRHLSLFLFGGEPLLKPKLGLNLARILKAWAETNGLGFDAGLVTNATLLTPDLVAELARLGRVFAQITLDGPEEIHDRKRRYRTGGGTYRDIIGALQRARAAGFDVKVRVNVDRDNADDIPRLLNALIREGLRGCRLTFCALSPLTRACAHYLPYLDNEETLARIPEMWRTALELGFPLDINPKSTPVYCGSITDSAVIVDPRLDVYKCYASVGLPEHRVGRLAASGELVKEYPYYDLLARDPLTFEESDCRDCRLLPVCGGGCALAAHMATGSYHHGRCDRLSKIIRERIRLFIRFRDRWRPEENQGAPS